MSISDADALKDELTRYIAKHLYRLAANLKRVNDLIELAQRAFPAGAPQTMKEDILRAAVVFMHATLEDFLRYVGLTYLPAAGEAVLDKISLIGSSDVLRAEKFFLGKLTKHRGKTVDQLISESVEAHLEKVSFSDPDDISRLLESCGISLDHVRQFYPTIAKLMARRHRIVHCADLEDAKTERPRDTIPIEATTVSKWHFTVISFISAVIAEKIGQDFGPRLTKAKAK